MLFADDKVLIRDNLEDVNNWLEKRKIELKGTWLRIISITEYLEYEFIGRKQ